MRFSLKASLTSWNSLLTDNWTHKHTHRDTQIQTSNYMFTVIQYTHFNSGFCQAQITIVVYPITVLLHQKCSNDIVRQSRPKKKSSLFENMRSESLTHTAEKKNCFTVRIRLSQWDQMSSLKLTILASMNWVVIVASQGVFCKFSVGVHNICVNCWYRYSGKSKDICVVSLVFCFFLL